MAGVDAFGGVARGISGVGEDLGLTASWGKESLLVHHGVVQDSGGQVGATGDDVSMKFRAPAIAGMVVGAAYKKVHYIWALVRERPSFGNYLVAAKRRWDVGIGHGLGPAAGSRPGKPVWAIEGPGRYVLAIGPAWW
jgi:hypothetical protein